jgi:hypothetical protein
VGGGEEIYVREKKTKKRKWKGVGAPDIEEVGIEEEHEEVVLETMFMFEAFEMVCFFLFLLCFLS